MHDQTSVAHWPASLAFADLLLWPKRKVRKSGSGSLIKNRLYARILAEQMIVVVAFDHHRRLKCGWHGSLWHHGSGVTIDQVQQRPDRFNR